MRFRYAVIEAVTKKTSEPYRHGRVNRRYHSRDVSSVDSLGVRLRENPEGSLAKDHSAWGWWCCRPFREQVAGTRSMKNETFSGYRRFYRLISVLVAALMWSVPAPAGVLFSDGFESGSFASSQNGISWGGGNSTSVSSQRAYNGRYSLRFTFESGRSGDDAFAEQRIRLPQRNEYWFKYRLYIPSNYHHRSDGASNNKFIAVYRDPYSSPGFQINLTLYPNSSGGSDVRVHYYNNGSEWSPRSIASKFIDAADKGAWMEVVVQVKVPSSSSSNDGIVRLWKNGKLVGGVTDLASWGGSGENYISEAYLLGWANSGFNEETVLYIDDVAIGDGPFDAGAPQTPAAAPQAPKDLRAQ